MYQEPVNTKTGVITLLDKKMVFFAFIIAIITFLVYIPALQNDFINWDDDLYVYKNLHIRQIDVNLLKSVFTAEVASLWHPLTLLSHALTYSIWGLAPWGHHLVNNIFHSFNTFLVFLVVVELIKLSVPTNNKPTIKLFLPAAITAFLFGIHPMHVESVAWVSERKDVLCAFFFLISILFYLKFASSINSKRTLYYITSLISFCMALMSKPMAVSLPLVLLILDIYPLQRLFKQAAFVNSRKIIIEKTPFFLLSLLCSFVTIWASHSGDALWTMNPISTSAHIATSAYAYIIYLIKIALPFNLAPLYPHPLEINPFSYKYVISIFLFLLVTFISIKSVKRNKIFLVVWLYYIITLIPVIGIVQAGEQIAADRYTYLPSIGPFFLASIGITYLYNVLHRWTKILIIVLLIFISGILSYKTVNQIAIWRDSISFWTHEIELFPSTVYIAYSERGTAYAGLDKLDLALNDFNMAIRLSPVTAEAYFNRGTLYLKQKKYYQAINDLSKAIQLDSRYYDAYVNRGIAKRKLGQNVEALSDLDIAIKLNSEDYSVFFNRGNLYFTLGEFKLAADNYEKTIELSPQFGQAYYALGAVYNKLGDSRKARIYRNEAYRFGIK